MSRLVFLGLLFLAKVVAAIPLIDNPNPCFHDYLSDVCTSFISEQRHVTLAEALELRRQALTLYANEESPTAAVYDRSTVAVACLASDGRRPGPDSDCAACWTVCSSTSTQCQCGDKPDVCELYCTRSRDLWQSSQRQTKLKTRPPIPTPIMEHSQRLEEQINTIIALLNKRFIVLTVLVTVLVILNLLMLVLFGAILMKLIKILKIRHEQDQFGAGKTSK